MYPAWKVALPMAITSTAGANFDQGWSPSPKWWSQGLGVGACCSSWTQKNGIQFLGFLSHGGSPKSSILVGFSPIHHPYPMIYYPLAWLVGSLEHVLFFHSVGNFIIPADFHIVQRGGSTTNQVWIPKVCNFWNSNFKGNNMFSSTLSMEGCSSVSHWLARDSIPKPLNKQRFYNWTKGTLAGTSMNPPYVYI